MFKKQTFNEQVWNQCKRIPQGGVSTYKEIANSLNTKAYRAVGNALNCNPHFPRVPCHRVVKSDGTVGGFAHGTKKKIILLKKEGISISERSKLFRQNIVNFDEILFRFSNSSQNNRS